LFEELMLLDKVKIFCKEYIVDFDAGAAMVRAGYSKKGARQAGWRMLQRADVQAELKNLMEEKTQRITEKNILSEEMIIKDLLEIKNRCMQAVPVTEKGEDGEEIETGVWEFEAGAAIKALGKLGDHMGMWKKIVKVESIEDMLKESDAE
jgi:phage terminase small subunit